MRRTIALFAASALLVSGPGLVQSTFAHGAACMAPPHPPQPPSDPPPPPEQGGPATGSSPSGSPSTGGGSGDGPTTGGGRGGGPSTGGGGGGGPSTGGGGSKNGALTGKARPKGVGGESWTKWWDFNKHELIPVKTAVREMQAGPNSRGLGGAARRTPTDAAVAERIVPLLRSLLVDPAQSYHVRSAAELGLAKIGDVDSVLMLELSALNVSRKLHREVEESGALALGLMARDDAEVREVLVGIVSGPSRQDTYVRPFAAVALGLIGTKSDPERIAQRALLDVVAREERERDVKPACLMGLGLLGDEAAVPELVALLGARRPGAQPTDVETAYAIAALGKIGRPGTARAGEETCALDEIARRLDPRANSSADVRRAGVIALGQIGPSCPPAALRDVVATLETSAVDSIDAQERHYAVVALGRIGGARGADAATRKRIGKFLVRQLGDRSAQTPAFAALALGLVGRGIVAEGGAAPEEEIRAPLRAKFKEGGDPEILGAFALASGLVKDALAVEALLATLADDGADKRVRGWSALALGLIGAPEAAPAVRSALTRETDYELRLHAAMAAALLRDPAAIPDVVEVLRDKDASNYELGGALLALGQFGDERAVDALLEIAGDTKGRWRPETRSVAVAALGRIGDRRDAPSLARVTADVDYRSNVPAIAELLSIL